MQVIIISSNGQTHKHWHLTPFKIISLSILILAIIVAFATVYNNISTPIPSSLYSSVEPDTPGDAIVNELTSHSEKNDEVEAYFAKRLGGLQAETIRLRALTEKLAMLSGFDSSELLLDEEGGQGGLAHEPISFSNEDFAFSLASLEDSLNKQSLQLSHLQDYLLTDETIKSAIPSGRPIKDGWISSYYGNRIDPFNGKQTFHQGIDFAGKLGSKVYSVADGIVSWRGKKNGYGELVEIDHGNGYVTRYAHNKTVIANVGDKVTKGQVIALMGSTGRSTGPHVHFEVLRDGKAINPYKFVKQSAL
jgi:murein DD-endopeptidase MepM/ murein hydrolase activator NlpD